MPAEPSREISTGAFLELTVGTAPSVEKTDGDYPASLAVPLSFVPD